MTTKAKVKAKSKGSPVIAAGTKGRTQRARRAKKRATPPAPAQAREPLRMGVRDPRPTVPPGDTIEEPRKPACKDLISVQRRVLWRKAGEPGAPSPWLALEKEPPRAQAAEKVFEQLTSIPPQEPSTPKRRTSAAVSTNPRLVAAQADALIADKNASMTMLPYRYTKGPDITNDEMGYGEQITDIFWRFDSSKNRLVAFPRISRRTKSGRQQLHPEPT